jgi:predicted site-specific integrase-resolvase
VYIKERFFMYISKPNEFAALVGVSVKTLQRWDNDGKLKAYRYYTHKQYMDYMDDGNSKHGKIIIYTRVSPANFSLHMKAGL